jgi:heterodisulfide reductase subunit B
MELRYCPACHLALEASQIFCERCGQSSVPLPSMYAVNYAMSEFPDFVATREDFDRLIL